MRGEIEQLKHALYGKRSEKGSNASSPRKNKTKKEAESEYIKNGSKKPETKAAEIADDDDDGVDEDTMPESPTSGRQPTPQGRKNSGIRPTVRPSTIRCAPTNTIVIWKFLRNWDWNHKADKPSL